MKRVVAQDTKGEGKRVAEEERSGEERRGEEWTGEEREEKRREERRGEERRRGAKGGTVEERPRREEGKERPHLKTTPTTVKLSRGSTSTRSHAGTC
jgi:hypothetical protein